MKIGLNLLYLLPGEVGGTETYAVGLMKGLHRINTSHEFVVFVNERSVEWSSSHVPGFETVVCPIAGTNRERRYMFEQVQLPRMARALRLDLMHSLGYASPLVMACPSVVTVHDLNFRAFGSSMPWHRRLGLSFFVGQAIRRSTKVLTVSEFSRKEILKYYRVAPDKIIAIHSGPGSGVSREADGAPKALPAGIAQPYCVAFSSSSPNKNIPALLGAFRRLKDQRKLAHRLVLVGHTFSDAASAQDPGPGGGLDGVVQTGYLNDDVLTDVLRAADFLVFPSFYEGFGLPVLEAMALGVPVVCSSTGSLPEVAGTAAVYFRPDSPDEMAAKILEVAQSAELRRILQKKGYENVLRFSWDRTAQRVLEVYEQIGMEHAR